MNNGLHSWPNKKMWHYDSLTILLHWTIAFLLIGLIILGLYMISIEKQPNSGWYFNAHKSFGLVAAALILLRLFWRLNHKPAPLPTTVPLWQAKITRLIHWLLYICIIIMPVTGFLGASFSKHGVIFFGLQVPTWVNQNHGIAEQFFEVHKFVAWILITLIVLHVLAAFKHLFINKDKVFQRMWIA